MFATSAMGDSSQQSKGELKLEKLSGAMEKTSTEFLRIAKLYRIVNFVPADRPPSFEHRVSFRSDHLVAES